jgi:CubicO group peptidase (beta-lactamase class C family)
MNILFAALLAVNPPAPSAAAPAEAIHRCAALLTENDRFAGTVAVSRRGDLLFSHVYPETADAAGADMPYNVASLGKMFTAVAIGQLVDSGRIAFDDPIGRHLPDLPPELGRITIAQLLNHTSGLADYLRPENRAAIAAARNARDLLPLALAGPLQFEPGSRRAYSNSGFVVLGAIVETLRGESYADYVGRHIFAPAGMTRSSLVAPAGVAVPMTRRGAEAPGPRRPAPIIDGGRASPAGGAYSSAGDLVRFADALLANRLTRTATTEALIRTVGPTRTGPNGEVRGYGFGFNVTEMGAMRFAGHGGGSPGMNAELLFSPVTGMAVAILSNYDPPAATAIADFARAALARPESPPDPSQCLEPPPPPPGA